jgi:hypothetical protein
MKIFKVQRALIYLGLMAVPFLSFGEIVALFTGSLNDQTTNLTGFIKFSKDIIIINLIVLGILYIINRSTVDRAGFLALIFLLLIITPSMVFGISNEALMFLSGVRWLAPLFLIFFIYPCINKDFYKTLSNIMAILFLLHLLLQIVQSIFMSDWYGTNALGLNSRNPGFFLIPNTGAFFSLIILYYILYLSELSIRIKFASVPLFFLSILLTLSGTGFVIFFIIVFFWLFKLKYFSYGLLLSILVIPIMQFGLEIFYNRGEDYIQISGGTRIHIFIETLERVGLYSSYFGMGTNSYVMIGSGVIMDSLYASILMNLGLLGLIFTITFITCLFIISVYLKDKSLLVFIIFIGLYSATSIIFEAYPMNLIIVLISIYFLKKYSRRGLL